MRLFLVLLLAVPAFAASPAKPVPITDGVICQCDARRGFTPTCVAVASEPPQCYGIFPCEYYGTCPVVAPGTAKDETPPTASPGPITRAMLQQAERYEPVAVYRHGTLVPPPHPAHRPR